MLLVTEMTLPSLPVHDPGFAADPMPLVEEARRRHPWLAKFNEGYIVHGYQATKDLIYMDDKLRPSFGGIVEIFGAQGTHWARFMEEMLVSSSGPQHTRLRASVAEAFTPRSVNRHRALMRQVITKLLDEWTPSGQFDFALFASYFPVTVMCGLLGVSADPIPSIRDSLETQVASLTLDRKLLPALLAGYDVLWNFADTLVLEREKSDGDGSLLDSLIAARTAGRLDDTELRFMLMVLLTAGYDTSKNMLTMIMHMMLNRPEQWARCAEDAEFCRKVVTEMLRHSAITTPYRMVAEEFVYDDIRFPEGAMLIFATALSGRDPAVFPDPMEFQPERVNANRHVAFGRGAHICLGQHLAKTQLEEGLQLLAQRVTNPRLAGEVSWRPFLGVWGLRTLPIAFEPAPARAPSQAQGCPSQV